MLWVSVMTATMPRRFRARPSTRAMIQDVRRLSDWIDTRQCRRRSAMCLCLEEDLQRSRSSFASAARFDYEHEQKEEKCGRAAKANPPPECVDVDHGFGS